jgi:hypothetical protein
MASRAGSPHSQSIFFKTPFPSTGKGVFLVSLPHAFLRSLFMRIPVSIATPLCLVVAGVTWFIGTRDKDFVTPPAGLIVPDVSNAQEPNSAQPIAPMTGNTESPVTLDAFSDQASQGHTHLIQLARAMEQAGWLHLAWLAWERVLDSTTPPEEETKQAQTAIRALRGKSASHSDLVRYPQPPLSIFLRAGTAQKHVAEIQPHLESIAQQIESASSGILQVRAHVTGGTNPPDTSAHTPVAIWLSGPHPDSSSSEVLSFTVHPDIPLGERIQSSISQLLRSLTARSLVQPPEPKTGTSFTEELSDSITRRAWLTIGTLLNSSENTHP